FERDGAAVSDLQISLLQIRNANVSEYQVTCGRGETKASEGLVVAVKGAALGKPGRCSVGAQDERLFAVRNAQHFAVVVEVDGGYTSAVRVAHYDVVYQYRSGELHGRIYIAAS